MLVLVGVGRLLLVRLLDIAVRVVLALQRRLLLVRVVLRLPLGIRTGRAATGLLAVGMVALDLIALDRAVAVLLTAVLRAAVRAGGVGVSWYCSPPYCPAGYWW